jgi:hypothetical protein
MKHLARFLFENSPWGPFWTAWSVGYVIVGADGQVYLTDAGAEYLATAQVQRANQRRAA